MKKFLITLLIIIPLSSYSQFNIHELIELAKENQMTDVILFKKGYKFENHNNETNQTSYVFWDGEITRYIITEEP